ncbi:MAG: ribonuclease P protein component [Bacteroidota bacterium]|nr:ribonuclease P protein component [Bacteroidota bacterium]
MGKSDDLSYDDKGLRKDEIIKGHNAYIRVLQNHVYISTEFLKAFINKQSIVSDSIDNAVRIRLIGESPLFTNNVKVGFIIAKKKIKKSVLRNRIKRLLKESYRLNKNFKALSFRLDIIFSLTERGYEQFINYPKTKLEFIHEEMKNLQLKIKNQFQV